MSLYSNNLLNILFFFLLLIGFILTNIHLISEWNWILDLFTNFRVYYLIAILPFIVIFIWRKNYIYLLLSLVLLAINLYYIYPLYISSKQSPNHRIQILYSNLSIHNKNSGTLLEYIRQIDPPIVAVSELNESHNNVLKPISQTYPYQLILPREDQFGIGLYSKIPLEFSEIIFLGNPYFPSIHVTIKVQSSEIHILVVHPPPPVSHEFAYYRNLHYKELSQLAQKLKSKIILVGDMNSTIWSPHFQNLFLSNIFKPTNGFGLQTSWNEDTSIIKLPIDHCIVSQDLHIIKFQKGKNIGSDHTPILCEIGY